MRFAVLPAIVLVFFGARTEAWSTKEHIQITRMAVERLLGDASTSPEMAAYKNGGGESRRFDAEVFAAAGVVQAAQELDGNQILKADDTNPGNY